MIVIPREQAQLIANLPGIESQLGLLKCARTNDEKEFAAKPVEWPPYCHNYPIRLAMEYIYYALAHANAVSLPLARILDCNGALFWGVQIVAGRRKLGESGVDIPAAFCAEIKQCLLDHPAEGDSFLRVSFLDVLLLNQDRTESNILVQRVGGRLQLFYFDHEQSLGWRNNLHVSADNHINLPAEEYDRIAMRYSSRFRHYKWARDISTRQQRRAIFTKLQLDAGALDEIRPNIPFGWIDDDRFAETGARLMEWWAFLKERPYDELDELIFG